MQSQSKITPVILESAEIHISGNTNIADFKCQLLQLNSNDTISYETEILNEAKLFEGMELQFCVSNFICDKSLMTSDLKNTLKEKDYPYITLVIDKVIVNEQSQHKSPTVSAYITLRIAGYADCEYIENAFITKTENHLTLTGIHNVLMTRFQIEPPTKLFGAVRTEDAIEISFSITLR